jgi:Amt family ammonium transporter
MNAAVISQAQWDGIIKRLNALDQNISTISAAQAAPSSVALAGGSDLNSGDTAWILASTALVLLMILPGIALFYGGMCQAKNVLSTVMQTYSIACLVTLMWIAFSYSLCFSTGSPVLGNADRFWLIGTRDTGNQKSQYRLAPNSAHPLAPTIPESVFIVYQGTFAIITAVLVCGSFAERMSFRAMLVFIFFWHIIVYCPVAHSSWAVDGWLALKGDLDFAGGNVVHVSSGMSGLAASIVIGPRRGWGVVDMKPHNIVYTVIGASLLWVGWFGFNAGSALSAGTVAGFAMLVTHICAATGGFVWMTIEYFHKGKCSVIGMVRCQPPKQPHLRPPAPPPSPPTPTPGHLLPTVRRVPAIALRLLR